jgi:DNA-binding GntR family transcriptional regulator
MARLSVPPTEVLFDRASDKVYEQLRRLIISLDLEPGALLQESALTAQLSCGRTPLREALQRLHEEGLVVALPRRAVSVADITVAGLQQLYEARWELEPALGRLAARRIANPELRSLEQVLEAGPASAESFAVTEWDMAFHRTIAEAAGNRYLRSAFDRIQGVAQRLLVFAYSHGPFVAPTIDEHRAILTALEAHDPERVASLLDQHIHHAKDRIVRTL